MSNTVSAIFVPAKNPPIPSSISPITVPAGIVTNSSNIAAWKVELQRLADEFGLTITIGHFPPVASKWNPIEHRMFSLISANRAGEPLTSYEVVLKFICATRSTTGFRCRATLDKNAYPKKALVTDGQKDAVQLTPHRVLPKWNYTIRPRKR